jgi:hypothetical protein
VYKFGPLAFAWRLDGGPPPPSAAMLADHDEKMRLKGIIIKDEDDE